MVVADTAVADEANGNANEDGINVIKCERRQRRCRDTPCGRDANCRRRKRCDYWLSKSCASLLQTASADEANEDEAVADEANEDGINVIKCERRQRRCRDTPCGRDANCRRRKRC